MSIRETPQCTTLGPHDIESDGYKLLESDVRDGSLITDKLQGMGVDPSRPTFILTECLLIYMKASDTQEVLNWTIDFFS